MDQPSPQSSPSSSAQAPKNGNKIVAAIVGIVVALIAGVYVMKQKKQAPETMENGTEKQSPDASAPSQEEPSLVVPDASAPMPVPPDPGAENSAIPEMIAIEYKDGIYSAVGDYLSPGGPEQIGVTITLKDDIVTESSVEVLAQRPISIDKQKVFSQNYKQFVIGKDIDEVALTKISSSSLTPKGFMDALEEIKNKAKQS